MSGSAHRPAVVVFFVVYLFLGLRASGDFGVHIDEYHNQFFGKRWGAYVDKVFSTGRVPETCEYVHEAPFWEDNYQAAHNLCHGPVWEVVLFEAQKIFLGADKDSRDIILFRHRANFLLFFLSAIFFYKVCRTVFRSGWLGLAGCLILVLHPRIFADSFYNTVDSAFLSFYIMSTYTLLKFIKQKSISTAIWHAFMCAVLVDIRVVGLIMPFVTTSLIGMDLFEKKSRNTRPHLLRMLCVHLFVFAAFMVLFWPFLWHDTFSNFIRSIMSGTGPNIRFTNAVSQRRYGSKPQYSLIWIVATTPPVYLFLFILGVARDMVPIFKEDLKNSVRNRGFYAALFLLGAPLLITMVIQPFLNDGWRHHYFIYSPFVILCVFGIQNLLAAAKKIRLLSLQRAAVVSITVLTLMGFLNTVSFMVRNHPFQFVYANILSRKISRMTKYAFINDYWRVSHRQALEFILSHDARSPISVYFPDFLERIWGYNNIAIIPKADRARLRLSDDPKKADYIIAGSDNGIGIKYDQKGAPLSLPTESCYTIDVEGQAILIVYKK